MAEKEKAARIWATISQERHEQLRAWADEMGIQFSQYIALVAWMGATQLNRTLHPEQFITPEMMVSAAAKSMSPEFMEQAVTKAALAMLEKLSPGMIDIEKLMEIAGGIEDGTLPE